MAKITRAVMKIFGQNASTNQRAVFGSLAAASPAFTTSPVTIQSLSNYLDGWFGAVVGGNSPAIEDMNSLCYLFAYQLAYVMQQGVPEWDATTTYYTGSLVNSGGQLYKSLQDDNLNHAITDGSWWSSSDNQITTVNPATQSPYTLASSDYGKTFLVQSANGAMQFNLPSPASNFFFIVKDRDGSFDTNPLTIHRNASESIEGVASDYVSYAAWAEYRFTTNLTNWFITGR